MTGARTSTLAALRGTIAHAERLTPAGTGPERVPLGHGAVDEALQGGLARGALHEVFADGGDGAAGTGFVAGLLARLAGGGRYALWVRQDFSARENGELSMSGLAELGLDPRRLVVVRAHDAEMALRVTADGLACNALAAVVTEIWGETRAFDLVASRKLTLASAQSGVASLMLRIAASPQASTAETRWIVRATRSPPEAAGTGFGAPVLDAHLVRNRRGPLGRWIMGWSGDEYRFRDAQTYSQPLAALPADRPRSPLAEHGGGQKRRRAS